MTRLISAFSAFALLPLLAADQAATEAGRIWRGLAMNAQANVKQSRFAEAAGSGNQALRIAKHFGSSDPRLATSYHLLGIIYREWGRCGEARNNFAHAIAIWRRQPQPTPRYIFNSITSMIGAMCECDEYDAAEKAFRAYAPELQRYTADALDESKLYSLRGVLQRGKKSYGKAESYFRQAIELMEKTPGTNAVEIALERSNLAVVFNLQHRYAESLDESERVIEVLGQAFPRHPTLVAALNNAACALADLGRKDESQRMFERALSAAQDLYGEENHVSAKIMLSYARVLRENNQLPAAEAFQKKGAEAFRRSLLRDAGTVDIEELHPPGK
jgi:tetratricopeptide (TPR) repeat protein